MRLPSERGAWPAAAVLILAGVFAGGCFEDEAPGDAAPNQAAAAHAEPADPAADVLTPVTFDTWSEALAGYKPEIVVVDMWATWCVSCIERFPEMVELSRKYAGEGVQFVSLCLDDHTDEAAVEKARAFLADSGAERMDHYLMRENMMDAFERLDLLGIPAVLVYGPEGREQARLTGDDPNNQFDEDDVEAAVTALLQKGGS